MYDVSITVSACLRAGTRADVAWLVSSDGLPVADWSNAVVFTPGGGRTGSLLGGAIDDKLGDMAGQGSTGRLVDLEVSAVDALIAGLDSPGSARCLLVPAHGLPEDVWPLATARKDFCLVLETDGREVVSAETYGLDVLPPDRRELEAAMSVQGSGSIISGSRVISVFRAVPRVVVVGVTPVGEAVAEMARFVGWQARVTADPDTVVGLIAPLSSSDKVVVTAHDLELAGAALSAAIQSDCGYIGSLGSRKMQEDRADWLAYRGVTDLSRIHGPAGLDIGAETPEEIAVAIVAETIAESRATSTR